MTDALRSMDVVRVTERGRQIASDRVSTEEPLEVRLHGRAFAVIMRTPGADRELGAGFLFSERVLRSVDDLGAIEHCGDPDAGSRSNVINVTFAGPAVATLERTLAERRQVTMNSSCGLCGRPTIESLKTEGAPLAAAGVVSQSLILELPGRLRDAQAVFDETGGLHAAGLFRMDGALETTAEDVGRHNAVDKVIGRMLIGDALPLSASVLFVSGRASFEIVQKAFFASIPVVASVSAPSTLAIDLAREVGITLVGFVRGARFNIYSHANRIS